MSYGAAIVVMAVTTHPIGAGGRDQPAEGPHAIPAHTNTREKRSERISALKKAVSSEHTSEQMQCLQNFSPFTCFTLAIDIFISKEVVAIVTRYFIPLVHISERLYVSIRSTCRHKLRGEGGEGRGREW